MMILDATTIALGLRRAMQRDLQRARRQWPMGVTLCVGVAGFVMVIVGAR